MKNYTLIVLSLLLSCCQTTMDRKMEIDLNNIEKPLLYSSFVNSISYINLNTNDSCLISGVEKIYIDGDTVLIEDTKKGGIFVFTTKGEFIKQINYYGNAPGEFSRISSYTIDKNKNNICIYDGNNKKINRYDYSGNYISSHKTEHIFRDFSIINSQYLCIMPSYRREDIPYGIWISDINGNIVKKIKEDDPKDFEFEFYYTNYNLLDNSILYYDRNYDKYLYINEDTVILEYEFNLKQQIPKEIRRKSDPTMEELRDYAMMANFSNSNNYIMLTYYIFGDDPFKWVLVDKEKKMTHVYSSLKNDIDNINSSEPYIYYLSDSVWCRVLDLKEDDCSIELQIMHLKENLDI